MSIQSAPIRSIGGLRYLADHYDLYLFDQWGVIHDGRSPYPQVSQALTRLRRMTGKTLLVLSNSSKSAEHSRQLMQLMGLDTDLFDEIITSGEHFLQCLRERPAGFYQQLGQRYYSIHWPEGFHLPEDLRHYRPTATLEEADFILLSGLSQATACYTALLKRARELNIPMICANPDLYSPEGNGLKPCPGQLALQYRQMGGTLISHGKPDKSLYDIVLQQFSCPDHRVLAVGDSLHHDIRGANRAGIASWFLTQGVHQAEWQLLSQQYGETEAADRLGAQHQVRIDYVSQSLRW